MIAGVCGGLAEYFETDPTLVRIIFVFLGLMGATGLFLYLIIWFILDNKERSEHGHEELAHSGHKHPLEIRSLLGFFVILIGVLFLVENFFPGYGIEKFWPIFLIFFGVLIMIHRKTNS